MVRGKPGETGFTEIQQGDNFKEEGMVNSVKYRMLQYDCRILIDYTVFEGQSPNSETV